MSNCQCYLDNKGRNCKNKAKAGEIYCYIHSQMFPSPPKLIGGDDQLPKLVHILNELKKSLFVAWRELRCCGNDILKLGNLRDTNEQQQKYLSILSELYGAMQSSIAQDLDDLPIMSIDNNIFTQEYYDILREDYYKQQHHDLDQEQFVSFNEYIEGEFDNMYIPLIDTFYDNYLAFYKRLQSRLQWYKLPRYQ